MDQDHYPHNSTPPPLDLDQVAEEIGVTRSCVENWIGQGELVALKIGRTRRVERATLDAYWERKRSEAEAEAEARKNGTGSGRNLRAI